MKQTRDENLILAARCALADLEGIMPEFEPSGERRHPGWQTIKDLQKALNEAGETDIVPDAEESDDDDNDNDNK